MPEVVIVEAFPNAFLGVLLPDEVYLAGGFRKRKKFDWLYEHAVRLGRLDLVFEALEWDHRRLLERMKLERDHERRAAYICLLTAALAHTSTGHVVGDELGGWLWLPPLNLWAGWAREALSETWLGV
jgi:hypothetical protein